MKLIGINTCNFGSTGNIMLSLAQIAHENGHDSYVSYPKSKSNLNKHQKTDLMIGNRFSRNLHLKIAEITGLNGCFSVCSTKKYLSKVKRITPSLIHMHNLHNCYINLPLLFRYIKRHNIPIVWTLHDCWSFTGHCTYFDMVKCNKWKSDCNQCPIYREYPKSIFDNSKIMHRLKKKWFTGVENMTIVTPSYWLADLVKQSYLKDYPIKVIHNGIDLDVFKPTKNNVREKYKISNDKYIVLGVAFGWDERKGLDIFIELAKRLDGKLYQIILVGIDEAVDEKVPKNIVSIHRTHNQQELAEIYSAANVFVNPTREDNFPTVNMEALACGTPGITYRTGGSPECYDETCGVVVERGDIDALEKEIIRICETKPYSIENCLLRAKAFDKNKKFQEYMELYEVLNGRK